MNNSQDKKRWLQAGVSAFVEPLEQRVLFSRLVGLDVSEFQGTLSQTNWNTIASNKQFVIMRASYGSNSQDDKFTNNAPKAIAAGMYAGFYHYAYYDNAGSTPNAEADNFWNTVSGYMAADGKHLMPVLDVEENGDPTNGQSLSAWVNSWCERVISNAAADGLTVHPMIYCNLSDALRLDGSGASYVPSKHYPLWLARWNSPSNVQIDQPEMAIGSSQIPWQHALNPTFKYSCWSFWQYTSTGSTSGISGNVDLDVFQGDTDVIQDYVVGSSRWSIGTRVQVTRWDNDINVLNNYDGGGTTGTQPNGATGTIIGGPEYGASFIRYNVDFDTGADGWVGVYDSVAPPGDANAGTAIDWISTAVPGVATNPNPANSATPVATLPSTFTWTGHNASSYRVYLDGVFKGVVSGPSYTPGAIADGTHTWRVDSLNGGLTTTGNTWTFDLQIAPPAPSMPNLSGASDSGISNSDDITNVNAPTFFGTAQANSTVKLYVAGAALIGTGTANGVGQWNITAAAPLADGTYSVTATATDDLGSTSDPSAALNITIDTTAPGDAYGGQTPARGDGTMNFTIVYTDGGSGMDVGSFDSSDITVTGPNGYNATATFVSVDVAANGSPRTVTYQIPAPGGAWTLDDNGTYTVQTIAGQTQDVAGNFTPSGTIATFDATIPFAYLDGTTLYVDFDGSTNPITLGISGADITATQNSTTYNFANASVASIIAVGTGSDDHLTIGAAISQPITFNGGAGNDTLDVNAGTMTFNSDAQTTTDNLTINVASAAAVVFNSVQHLAALNLTGATASAGGNSALYLSNLSMDSSAQLDLNDNDLVVNSGDFSTIQNLVFTGYRDSVDPSATGIVSTTSQNAGGNTMLLLFDNSTVGATDWPTGSGQPIGANAIVGKYTYKGDTNLDGQVTAADYNAIDANLGTTGVDPGIAARLGDTNFDNNITTADYNAVDSGLGLGVGNPLILPPDAPEALSIHRAADLLL